METSKDQFEREKEKVEREWGVLREIELFAREKLRSMSHGFDHTRRVYNMAMRIGQREKADLKVVLTAALLHDIGRDLEDYLGIDHAETSAYLAEEFLNSIDFPKEKIKMVIDAIKEHRYSSGILPSSLESKVLSDADKLDALGAVGIARVFTYGGRHQRDVKGSLAHFDEKILKLKDLMYTESAKKVAQDRHFYIELYLKRLQEEIKGLK
ncbi:MAG: HD domain-containing protein [archaeon]